MGVRGWLHRLLGGATDDSGRPVPLEEERVAVFDGLEHDALIIRDAFHDAGIETTESVYVPLGAAWGASTDPHTVVSVRGADLVAANTLLDEIPHLGQRLMRTEDL
jgi:hypothetical protein